MMAELTFARFDRGEHQAILREHGLTPGHLKALGVLDPDEPRPMRAMAEALNVDASMCTWLVDRLEERGFVERRSLPKDRRVKTVVLTRRGIRLRDRLTEALYEPPPELLSLDVASLRALRSALAAATAFKGEHRAEAPAGDAATR